jgi:hypothetical protein
MRSENHELGTGFFVHKGIISAVKNKKTKHLCSQLYL